MPNHMQNPSIRFHGFTQDWEMRKLSDVAEVYDGVHQTPDYQDEGIMFLSVENISTLTSEKYISEEAYDRDYKVRPEKGDILMTRIGDVGTPNVVETNEKLAYYVSLALLKPKGITSYFLKNAIQSDSFQYGLRERTLLTAIPMKINKDEIGKVDILFPKSLDEQRKIGENFRLLDRLITLHQCKYDKLLNVKKSMLEKMFPKNGESIPQIRFQGFTQAWGKRKLGELGEFTSNGVDKKIYPNEKMVNLLNYMDVYNRRSVNAQNCDELMQVSAKDTQIKNNNVLKNDVFFTPTSETADDIGHAMVIEENLENTVYSYHLMRFRPYDNVFYSIFPNYCFDIQQVRQQMSVMAQGVQRFVLSKLQFESIEIMLPDIDEQARVSEYLRCLDTLITLQQSKLEKLKNIKKAMLGKMFV